MSEENVFNHIALNYYQLTASEKKLANFVTANGMRSQAMSISELAAACGVAEATISRFCRRLGYSGYSAFRLALAANTAARPEAAMLSGEIRPDDSVQDLCIKLAGAEIEAIRETQALIDPEALQAAAEILLAASTVLCMGQGGSLLLAEEAAHLFTTTFPGFFAVADSHMQVIAASHLTGRDAVLFFSYSGATKDLLDVMEVTRKQGTRVILVTRYPGSPGSAYADVVLQCGSVETPLHLGSIAARIAQLYLVDVLFSKMCQQDLERCRRHREQIADVMSNKYV